MSEKKRGKISRTFKLSITTQVQQLVTADERRTCLLVYNKSGSTVYILSAQTMAIADGIPVAVGASYVNDTSTSAYWIIAESTTADVRVQVDGD